MSKSDCAVEQIPPIASKSINEVNGEKSTKTPCNNNLRKLELASEVSKHLIICEVSIFKTEFLAFRGVAWICDN